MEVAILTIPKSNCLRPTFAYFPRKIGLDTVKFALVLAVCPMPTVGATASISDAPGSPHVVRNDNVGGLITIEPHRAALVAAAAWLFVAIALRDGAISNSRGLALQFIRKQKVPYTASRVSTKVR